VLLLIDCLSRRWRPSSTRHYFEESLPFSTARSRSFSGRNPLCGRRDSQTFPATAPHQFRNASVRPRDCCGLCSPAGPGRVFYGRWLPVSIARLLPQNSRGQPPPPPPAVAQAESRCARFKYRTEFLHPPAPMTATLSVLFMVPGSAFLHWTLLPVFAQRVLKGAITSVLNAFSDCSGRSWSFFAPHNSLYTPPATT